MRKIDVIVAYLSGFQRHGLKVIPWASFSATLGTLRFRSHHNFYCARALFQSIILIIVIDVIVLQQDIVYVIFMWRALLRNQFAFFPSTPWGFWTGAKDPCDRQSASLMWSCHIIQRLGGDASWQIVRHCTFTAILVEFGKWQQGFEMLQPEVWGACRVWNSEDVFDVVYRTSQMRSFCKEWQQRLNEVGASTQMSIMRIWEPWIPVVYHMMPQPG